MVCNGNNVEGLSDMKIVIIIASLCCFGVLHAQAENKILFDLRYGSDPLQKLDIYFPTPVLEPGDAKPLAVMVHGGAWFLGDKQGNNVLGHKKDYFLEKGFIFVSTNYRLAFNPADPDRPAYQHPAAVEDIASAIMFLREKAAVLGADANSILLVGHSAGAHLVSLLATNQKYIEQVGVPASSISGVISLDHTFYDLGRIYDEGGQRRLWIANAFGHNPLRHYDASPLFFVDGDTPPFIIFASPNKTQASLEDISYFEEQLRDCNILVSVDFIFGKSHEDFNIDFGKSGDPITEKVDKILPLLLD